jgi:hypothetical protein
MSDTPAVPLFANFGKQYKDLWKKKFDFDNIVKVTTKAPHGWTVATSAKIHKDVLHGVAKANFNYPAYGDGEIEADTGVGKLWGKITLGKLVPKAKFIFSGGLDPCSKDALVKRGPSVKAEAEYLISPSYGVSAGLLIAPHGNKIDGEVELTGSAGADGASVGGQFKAPVDALANYHVNFGAQYDYKGFTLSLLTEKQTDIIKLSWFHKASRSHALGVELVSDESKDAKRPRVMSFASEYQVDVDTLVKFRANNYGELATVVEHQIYGPSLTVAAAVEFIAKGSSSLRSDKFGVSVAFAP